MIRRLFLFLVVGSLRSAWGAESPTDDDKLRRVSDLVSQMAERVEKIDDYTCTFRIREFTAGELEPLSTIFMKHRKEPNCVYMKWLGGPSEGREAIYCDGMYENQLKVREGSGFASLLGILTLDPHGSVVMKTNRHPVTESGIYFPVRSIDIDVKRLLAEPPPGAVSNIHEEEIQGRRAICWLLDRPPGPVVYAPRSEICIDPELRLPSRIRNWDPPERLVESFAWSDFRLNVGLEDEDFGVENPDYGF